MTDPPFVLDKFSTIFDLEISLANSSSDTNLVSYPTVLIEIALSAIKSTNSFRSEVRSPKNNTSISFW